MLYTFLIILVASMLVLFSHVHVGVMFWAILPPTPARFSLLAILCLIMLVLVSILHRWGALKVQAVCLCRILAVLAPCVHDSVKSLSGAADLACRRASGPGNKPMFADAACVGGGRNRGTVSTHNCNWVAWFRVPV